MILLWAIAIGIPLAAEVDQDVAFGNEMKVTGTPTLFINGQRVSGYRAEQIRTLIREQTP